MNQTSLAERRKTIENIYPLVPMQEGLLFHSVFSDGQGLYVPQIVLHLSGVIDAGLLQSAWTEALARHSVLRSGFHWEERDQPFQVVHRDVALPWANLDWSDVDASLVDARLAALLEANRSTAFDLRRPPLMRLQWIDCGNGRFILVFCYHHLILDGWSASKVITDAFRLYVGGAGVALPPTRPFADYVAWLKRQDHAAAKAFWQDYLSGYDGSSRLLQSDAKGGQGGQDFVRYEWVSLPSLLHGLTSFCQRAGITLNTALQGALALLLAGRTGGDDALFGATTAGRPTTLPGAADMVGLFINTLPVRVTIDRAQTLAAWLRGIQAHQSETVEHEFLSLREIQGERGALFDCVLILESYPVSSDMGGKASFKLLKADFDEWTHFPLTLYAVADRESLKLTARYASNLLTGADLDAFLAEFGRLLQGFVDEPDAPMARYAPAAAATDRPAITTASPAPEPAPHRPTAPTSQNDTSKNGRVDPSTETEKVLAAAWADVLKQPLPSARDHFFELGGHSLLAARVVSRVRRELNIELPVKSLFDRPVLADLATYIDALRATTRSVAGHREIEI